MFQVSLIPYFISDTKAISYAHIQKETPCLSLELSGIGNKNDSLKETAIRSFAQRTGIYLNPIRFQQLLTQIMLPITEIENTIQNENILMIPRYYFAVHLPRLIHTVSSQEIILTWWSYPTILTKYPFIADQYALWELNERLITNKTDILPNRKAIKFKS